MEKNLTELPIRYCLYCTNKLTRNKYISNSRKRGWIWEGLTYFRKRIFCNHTCSKGYASGGREKKSVEKIYGYRRTSEDLVILIRDNFKCTVCTQPKPRLVIYTNGFPSKDPSIKTDLSHKQTICMSCLMKFKVKPFCSYVNTGVAKTERNSSIVYEYQNMDQQELAVKYGVTKQNISLIIRRAEKQGLIDYSELKKKRRQEAILIADKFNPLKSL